MGVVEVESHGAGAMAVGALALAAVRVPDAMGAATVGQLLIEAHAATIAWLVALISTAVAGVLPALARALRVLLQRHDGRLDDCQASVDVRQMHSLWG